SLVLMVGNFLIMFYLINREKFTPETTFLGSINMVQVSEFSLVVGGLAVTRGLIGNNILGYLSLMAIMTMGSSAYIIKNNHKLYDFFNKYLKRFESDSKGNYDFKELEDHAIVVGYNDIARNIIPVLKEYFDDVLVIGLNPDNVRYLKEANVDFMFGDFTHNEMRRAVCIKKAKFIISFAPDQSVNRKIIEDKDDDATVFLRATARKEAAEIYDLGADYIIMKNVLIADKMNEYLELYFDNKEEFDQKIEMDRELLYWGAKE
ncbi:MAG: NAD-binding protein, partial [Candidatus Aenigmatarchaeota archaeon]